MDFYEVINKRRSYRDYKANMPEKEKIERTKFEKPKDLKF